MMLLTLKTIEIGSHVHKCCVKCIDIWGRFEIIIFWTKFSGIFLDSCFGRLECTLHILFFFQILCIALQTLLRNIVWQSATKKSVYFGRTITINDGRQFKKYFFLFFFSAAIEILVVLFMFSYFCKTFAWQIFKNRVFYNCVLNEKWAE